MKEDSVYITDYISDPSIESEILGGALSPTSHEGIEVLIVWHEKINSSYTSRFPHLKGVVRYGVGYDNLDLEHLRSKGVYACNTPDYGVDEVSDTAMAMILNVSRGLCRYDHRCRDYITNWQENTLPSIKRTSETVLGVVGAGRIGGSVLLKARAMGYQTMFFDPYKPSGHEKMLGAMRTETLAELLAVADIVSVHVPLSDATRGMVNAEFLASMKLGASIVNTARGALLDQLDSLYEPLKSGRLDCACLDVLPEEPPPTSGKLIEAWRQRANWLDGRLVINPHTAYFSGAAYIEMRAKAAENALRILKGRKPLNIVNGLD
jgi:C-terminal binding protein